MIIFVVKYLIIHFYLKKILDNNFDTKRKILDYWKKYIFNVILFIIVTHLKIKENASLEIRNNVSFLTSSL